MREFDVNSVPCASYPLTGEDVSGVLPTMGQASDEVRFCKRTALTLLDLGGAEKIRGIWPRYFAEVHGFVFVVDASDRDRFNEARECLDGLLSHVYVKGKPFAVIANKADLPGAASPQDVDQALGVSALSDGGSGVGAATRSVPCVAVSSRPRRPHAGITRAIRDVLMQVQQNHESLEPRRAADMAAHAIEAAAALAAKRARVEKIRAERAKKAAAKAADDEVGGDEHGVSDPGEVRPAATAAAGAEIVPPQQQQTASPLPTDSVVTDASTFKDTPVLKPLKRARRNQVVPE